MGYRVGRWDLGGLDGGRGAAGQAALEADARRRARALGRHRARLRPGMPRGEFAAVLRDLERLARSAGIAAGYGPLAYAADTQSEEAAALMTRSSKLAADAANAALFFDLWWKRGLGDAAAARLMAGSGRLRGFLRRKRAMARHALGEPEERVINTLDVTGASALVKLYDMMTSAFRYRAPGSRRRVTREELTAYVRSPRAGHRRAAYAELLSAFESSRGVLGEIYQNVALNWRDEGVGMRGHASPLSVRNAENDVGDRAVGALLAACREGAAEFRRYFRLKASMVGMRRLRRYDLYAPAPAAPERRYGYGEAVRLVLGSLGRLDPGLAGHARRVVESGHVDSSVRPGKRDGAFCSTLAPDVVPYVLLSFTGRTRDVLTLAHELGHAAHSMAASSQSVLAQEPQLPLAETASTFSELLLYDSLSEGMGDGQRRAMLAGRLDDLYATISRQSQFTDFEADAHERIAGGATPAELSRAYLSGLRRQLGSSVDVSGDFGVEWACIPHFYHSPFYCYAYSFGNLLALSLFERYKREGRDFVPAYLDILSAGGSEAPEDLLSRHGMDMSSRRFWRGGFGYVRGQIRDLSRLA